MKTYLLLAIFLVFFQCSTTPKGSLKLEKYFNQGRVLYDLHCSNCHQPDGSGLGKLIPPLNNDFSSNNLSLTICSIKNGLNGPITVEGKRYNREMPANRKLTSLEIAQITTFISNSWDQNLGLTDVMKVDSVLNTCN